MHDGLRALGLELEPRSVDLFDRFRLLVVEANRRQNLTALQSDYEMAVKHFLDSLTCLSLGVFDQFARVVDIGSGAGFPGIPLKIARPVLDVTLLDSSAKKTDFLRRALAELGLGEGCHVVTGRAEKAGHAAGMRATFDLAVVRAVAPLAVDLEYGLPLLAEGGCLVAMKGPRAAEEMEQAVAAAALLGGALERAVEIRLPLGDERRTLVLFRKAGPTPDAYPRREGLPSKRPLGR